MFFNMVLEYLVKKLSVKNNSTALNRSAQLVEYADDLSIIAATITHLKNVNSSLEHVAREINVVVNERNTKLMGQSRYPRNQLENTVAFGDSTFKVV